MTAIHIVFFGKPIDLLFSISPSASHRLALTSCTTLTTCLANMTGKLTPASTHGQKLSNLFALANSRAAALCGFRKRDEGTGRAGEPG